MYPVDPDQEQSVFAGILIGCSECDTVVAWVPGIMSYAHDIELLASLQRITDMHVATSPDHHRKQSPE